MIYTPPPTHECVIQIYDRVDTKLNHTVDSGNTTAVCALRI